MFKTTIIRHKLVQNPLATMAKRTMADVVCQTDSLGQRFIQPQNACHSPPNLGYFNGMRQACTEIIVSAGAKYLRLTLKPAECTAVDYAVSVPFKIAPVRMCLNGVLTPAAVLGPNCKMFILGFQISNPRSISKERQP